LKINRSNNKSLPELPQNNFRIDKRQFGILIDFIAKNIGSANIISDFTRQKITTFVETRIQELGFVNFGAYIGLLRSSDKEFQLLVNHVVNLKSSFFRNPRGLRDLAYFIPEIASKFGDNRELIVWSAGCATGEEPYSLAMILKNDIRLKGFDIKIIATDISKKFLKRAKKGQYDKSALQSVRDEYFRRIFSMYTKKTDRGLEVVDEIKEMVEFKFHNLLNLPSTKAHMIFCRNVLIYFDLDTQVLILERFYDYLFNGGMFFLGEQEMIAMHAVQDDKKLFSRKGNEFFAYQKIED